MSGARTLLVDDRRFRAWTWLMLAATAVAWTLYFLFRREPQTRIALEIGTVALLVIAIVRAVWLRRRSPALAARRRSSVTALWNAIASPGVIAIKGGIATMILLEALGRVSFTWLEWTIASVVLAAAIAITVVRRRRRPFATLESLADATCVPGCPLGFGDSRSGRPDAHDARTDNAPLGELS